MAVESSFPMIKLYLKQQIHGVLSVIFLCSMYCLFVVVYLIARGLFELLS